MRAALSGLSSGRSWAVVERALRAIGRMNWLVILTGFFEPVLYLLAMGLGMGGMIGSIPGPDGRPMSYAAYIAPALMASSAMNGALIDSTFNVFFKIRFSKLYETMLSTSLGPADVAIGEIVMALLRGALYALGFLGVMGTMGLVTSWWALAMIPVALLIAFGFAALGMATTSFMRTFQQLDLVFLVMLPMFLLSSTLFPITVFPPVVQWLIMALPLWHGIELMRQLSVGILTPMTFVHVGYFVVLGVVGAIAVTLRLRKLFLR
ncbi:MAG: ABC transporter permease [Propionibacteriaceae bacterium]|nr:ABC transporter permease [Micropruina sp.]HBX80292.1 ABC transporter [Propionibacteriaceae bacterium]HBY22522.1 ABC transporter [Propionibacteriaceae bacterium]